MIRVLSLWISLQLLTAPTFAAVLRVPSQYATLNLASQAAVAEDTILVAPGTYDQLGAASNVRAGVSVFSEGGREVTTLTGFTGQTVGGLGFIRTPGITTRSRLRGFTIDGGAHAFGHYTIVEDNRIITRYRGMAAWWGNLYGSCEFRNNIIEGNADYWFSLFPDPPQSAEWVFEGNLFKYAQAFTGSFGLLDGPPQFSQKLVLRSNTGINFQGVDVGYNSSHTTVEVVNNLFYGTGGDFGYAELWCNGAPHITYDIRHNAWWNSLNLSCSYGTGNIFQNPMVCSPSTGDYRLHSSSPLIGAGEGGATIGAFGIGCGIVSGTGDSQSVQVPARLSVEPNPVRSIAMFRVEGAGQDQRLEIYSAEGQLKDALELIGGKAQWRAGSDLPRGIYFARVSGDQAARPIKFVVIR